MNSATLLLLIGLATSCITAYLGYWYGVDVTEKRSQAREAELLTALDHSVDTIQQLCRDRHPAGKGSHLTLVQGGVL